MPKVEAGVYFVSEVNHTLSDGGFEFAFTASLNTSNPVNVSLDLSYSHIFIEDQIHDVTGPDIYFSSDMHEELPRNEVLQSGLVDDWFI